MILILVMPLLSGRCYIFEMCILFDQNIFNIILSKSVVLHALLLIVI